MGIFLTAVFLVFVRVLYRHPILGALFGAFVGTMSQRASAEITDQGKSFSMLCVAEKGTGFNWDKNDWQQANYKPYTYVISKLVGDDSESKCFTRLRGENVAALITPTGDTSGRSKGCYVLKEIGEAVTLGNVCTEFWDKRGASYLLKEVTCTGGFEEYRARVDGPFVVTRTYAVFATVDPRDSVILQIGKCSLLQGSP